MGAGSKSSVDKEARTDFGGGRNLVWAVRKESNAVNRQSDDGVGLGLNTATTMPNWHIRIGVFTGSFIPVQAQQVADGDSVVTLLFRRKAK